jgi:diguanylate cyclase (GGDEF)-like protein
MASSNKLQRKLLGFFLGLLLAAQVATFAAVLIANQSNVRTEVKANLLVASRVFDRLLTARGQQVSQSVRVLSSEYPFRQAIATGDLPTIESVLTNHGSRIDASLVLLISLEGAVVADSREGIRAPSPFPYPSLVAKAEQTGEASSVVLLDDIPYQMVVVPVRAPLAIAWVAVAHQIDDAFLLELERATELEISFLSVADDRAAPFLASTLPAAARTDLLRSHESFRAVAQDSVREIEAGGDEYLSLVRPIVSGDKSQLFIIIQRDVAEAMRPYERLQWLLGAVSMLALIGSTIGAVIVSRGVTRPVKALVTEAVKIEQGDYSGKLHIEQDDEIGDLARVFNQMKDGIQEREERIIYQATHDSLTGLPNRALFLDRLEQSIALAKRSNTKIALAMMDLDRFKEINDTLGHFYGDRVLVEVGARLDAVIRESDTVARLGGDEFAVMFNSADEKTIAIVIGKLLDAFRDPFNLGEVRIDVDTSIGVVFYPPHGEDPRTLLQRADIAMYEAKNSQIDYAVYERGKDENSIERLSLMSELRQAIQNDDLVLHFQPKVDISSATTIHVEALVRWNHSRRGLLGPDSFIHLAERSGNIGLVTRWVLASAIRQVSAWRKDGIDVAVAVNLSAIDLLDSELPSEIRDLLAQHGVPSSRLLLEITESAVMSDPTYALRILTELKSLGIRLAIDDFGTGYSSLAHLKRLPVDELKIDKSFVMHMDANDDDAVIVRSTIELGHNMGLQVIAEGVENEKAWKILEQFGCDMAQGYFMSPPLPPHKLEKWLKESLWKAPITDPVARETSS